MFDIKLLEPAAAAGYARFAFPGCRAGLRETCIDERAVVLAASWLQEPAGLIIARTIPERQTGRIDSLFVRAGFRKSGLGARLLSDAGERLRIKGCKTVELAFPVSAKDDPGVRGVLRKNGWAGPDKYYEIAKYRADSFVWVNKIKFRGGDRAIPWDELKPDILETIKQGEDTWYPLWVSPFQERQHYPAASFWFSCNGEIAGWLITRLDGEDTLNYTTYYVREELQGSGRAMPLLAMGLKTQTELGIPYSSHLIYYNDLVNPYLVQFHEKHLRPYNVALEEWYRAVKT